MAQVYRIECGERKVFGMKYINKMVGLTGLDYSRRKVVGRTRVWNMECIGRL